MATEASKTRWKEGVESIEVENP